MRTNKSVVFILVVLLISLVSQIGYSQSYSYYVCPNSVSSFGLGNFEYPNPDASHLFIAGQMPPDNTWSYPKITGGERRFYDPETVRVQWDSALVSGGVTVPCYEWNSQSNSWITTSGSLSVTRVWADSVSINTIANSYNGDEACPVDITIDWENDGRASYSVTWQMYKDAGCDTLIAELDEQGAPVSFVPYDYLDKLVASIGEAYLANPEGINVYLKATISLCNQTLESTNPEQLTITPSPFEVPTGSYDAETTTTCSTSTDGRLVINSLTLNGETYGAGATLPPHGVYISFCEEDAQNSPIGNWPESRRVDRLSEFNTMDGLDILPPGRYVFVVERAAPDGNGGYVKSGVYRGKHAFTVSPGPELSLSLGLDDLAPSCYNSSLNSVTATVDNGSGLGRFTFYNGDIELGTSIDSTYDYNLSASGTYSLYAINQLVPVCRTDDPLNNLVEFANPVQNTFYLSSTPPTCQGGNDGRIVIDSIFYRDSTYTENFDESSLVFTVNGTLTYDLANFELPYTLDSIFESGNDTIWYTDTQGCSSEIKTIFVRDTINNAVVIEGISPANITNCNHFSRNGSVSVTAHGGNSYPLSYSLYRAYVDTVVATGDTTVFEQIADTGSYYVITKDVCQTADTSETVTIEELKPVISASDITNTDAVCYGDTARIIVHGFSYNGESITSADAGNFIVSFERDTYYDEVGLEGLPYAYTNVYGGQTWGIKVAHKDSACVSEPDSVDIGQQDPLLASITHIDSVRCHDQENGSIRINSTDGNQNPERTFSISPNPYDNPGDATLTTTSGEALFENLPANSYTLTVTDACPNYGSQELTAVVHNYPQILADISEEDISCHGFNDGIIRVAPTSGIGSFTARLLDTAYVINIAPSASGSFIGLKANDNYRIELSDINTCSDTIENITIVDPPALEFVNNGDYVTHITCWDGNTGSLLLRATGGTAPLYFSLNGADSLAAAFVGPNYEIMFNGLGAGTFEVDLIDQNNCRLTETYELLQPPEYKIDTIYTDSTICHGGLDGSLFVGVEGGTPDNNNYTYNLMLDDGGDWQLQESITGTTATFRNLAAGNYFVNIVDSNSCELPSGIQLLGEPERIRIDAPSLSAASCYDVEEITISASAEGGTGGLTYHWLDMNDNEVGTVPEIIVSEEGLYTLYVSDASNCAYGNTAPGPAIFGYPVTVTKPDTLRLAIDEQFDVDYHGLSNGSVYVRDGSGCASSISTVITQPDPFVVSLDNGNTLDVNCFGGNDGQITIDASGGRPPYTFTLDDGLGNTITQEDNPVFNNLVTGNYSVSVAYNTYQETVNNILVGQPASALASSISGYQYANCQLTDGWATASATGGTAPYTYLWNDNQSTITASSLSSGDYFVQVKDFNNCLDTSWITLYNIGGPEATIGQVDNLPCFGSDNVGGITINVTNGTAPYTIQWDDPASQTGLIASNLGTGMYSATVSDANGCIINTGGIEITKPEELLISFDDFVDPSCYGYNNGEITTSGSGGTPPYYFEWQNATGVGNTGIATDLTAGTYTLQLRDENNCLATGNFELRDPDEIIIDIPDSVFICQGQTVTLDAGNAGALYDWVSETGFSSTDQVINVQDPGDYVVQVSNVQGCSSSAKTHIKFENRQFYATFLMASEATMADTIVLIEHSLPVPDSVEWYMDDNFVFLTDGDAYKELLPLQTGDYVVGMKAYYAGCSETVEKRISIVPGHGPSNKMASSNDLIQSAKLFPNPNTGVFEVEVKLNEEADLTADLFTMQGLRVIPTKYEYNNKEYLIKFNLTGLNPGIYFVNVVAGEEMRKLKFVVRD